jgi:hypothetical protein
MKSTSKTLLVLLFVAIFACGLALWAESSPIVDDYIWIYDRDRELDLVRAFATALRINHPAAYDMINPSLKPRLDAWMNVHQSEECSYQADVFLVGSGTKEGHKVFFDCYSQNKWLSFEVDNIVIKDMRVVDWGEVKEE